MMLTTLLVALFALGIGSINAQYPAYRYPYPYPNMPVRPTTPITQAAALLRLEVRVTTAKEQGAGTDAQVYLYGQGPEQQFSVPLIKPGAAFDAGSDHTFEVSVPVSRICIMGLSLSGRSSQTPWLPEILEIREATTKKIIFSAALLNWIDYARPFTASLLYPGQQCTRLESGQIQDSVEHPFLEVKVRVRTSQAAQAGTDARVYFIASGPGREFGLTLDRPDQDDFKAGDVGEYSLRLPVAKLCTIGLMIQATGRDNTWLPDSLEVLDQTGAVIAATGISQWIDPFRPFAANVLKAGQQCA